LQDAKAKDIEDVLILSGDHLYRMDYMDFVQVTTTDKSSLPFGCSSNAFLISFLQFNLQSHRQRDAGISICCLPIDGR
jgi:glucose-1-phosphate adenylyltransferase